MNDRLTVDLASLFHEVQTPKKSEIIVSTFHRQVVSSKINLFKILKLYTLLSITFSQDVTAGKEQAHS